MCNLPIIQTYILPFGHFDNKNSIITKKANGIIRFYTFFNDFGLIKPFEAIFSSSPGVQRAAPAERKGPVKRQLPDGLPL